MINIEKIIENNSIKVFFQVIISPVDILSFNVESFIRGIDTDTGETIPPSLLFREAFKQGLSNELDKVCIQKIYRIFKPISRLNPRTMLHINISKGFIPEASDSMYLAQCARDEGVTPTRIVIDINNFDLDDISIQKITTFIDLHRKAGFYISIDDIGRDYCNIDKIMVFNPDIIKINHQMLNNLSNKSYQVNLIHNITTIAHQMGILVISTGIETQEHLVDAVKSGAQLLQGFYLSPTAELNYEAIRQIIDDFDQEKVYKILNAEHVVNEKSVIVNIVSFNTDLRTHLVDFDITQIYTYAKKVLAKYPFIESGYLLNKDGIQVSDTFINKDNFGTRNKELFGLYEVGFDHSDEETFYRLQSPILTDWTIKPFRSRLTNELCVTGSFKVGTDESPYVVVLNFDYIQFEAYLARIEPPKHISLMS